MLTDWLLDDELSCGLHKRSDADGVLRSHSEEVGLSEGEVARHSILSAGRVRERRPGFTLSFTFLNDIVADGRAAIILREEPVELAGVDGQVLSDKRNTNRPRNVYIKTEVNS